jgi:aryl carrier-like protein
MNRRALLNKVKKLGYPLLETEEVLDVNQTLAEVVRSHDLRLWEGFPVMLAHSLEINQFSYDQILSHLEDMKEREDFRNLVGMSLALYRYLELEFVFVDRLVQSEYFNRDLHAEYVKAFRDKKDLNLIDRGLSSARMINTFKNYFRRAEIDLIEYSDKQDEFELEHAMSQIFSKKQKELFLKKLKGERLTKTEREYYSRVVKKKVFALANSDLHKLAVRLTKE